MQARARWLLAAAVLVPGLVIGVMATALLLPPDPDPQGWATETTLWLGIAAVLAVAFGLGLAALRLWLVGPVERLARQVESVPVALEGDAVARLETALEWYRRQGDRDRVLLAGQLDAAGVLRDETAGVRAQLQESDRLALVGRVAMGVAHEIGGPLALLSGWLERLETLDRQGATPEQRAKCIAQMTEAAAQIERLLTELARPGLAQNRDADRPCDIRAVVEQLQAQLAVHPRLRQVSVEVAFTAPEHPADLSASHLQQVLLNLVLNAADAMKRQGSVRVSVSQDGAWQIVDVDDTGPGVPLELREQIFEPLFSTHASPGATGQGGWGLGLAIARRTLASYGGSLTVADSPLGGARFRVKVPTQLH